MINHAVQMCPNVAAVGETHPNGGRRHSTRRRLTAMGPHSQVSATCGRPRPEACDDDLCIRLHALHDEARCGRRRAATCSGLIGGAATGTCGDDTPRPPGAAADVRACLRATGSAVIRHRRGACLCNREARTCPELISADAPWNSAAPAPPPKMCATPSLCLGQILGRLARGRAAARRGPPEAPPLGARPTAPGCAAAPHPCAPPAAPWHRGATRPTTDAGAESTTHMRRVTSTTTTLTSADLFVRLQVCGGSDEYTPAGKTPRTDPHEGGRSTSASDWPQRAQMWSEVESCKSDGLCTDLKVRPRRCKPCQWHRLLPNSGLCANDSDRRPVLVRNGAPPSNLNCVSPVHCAQSWSPDPTQLPTALRCRDIDFAPPRVPCCRANVAKATGHNAPAESETSAELRRYFGRR